MHATFKLLERDVNHYLRHGPGPTRCSRPLWLWVSVSPTGEERGGGEGGKKARHTKSRRGLACALHEQMDGGASALDDVDSFRVRHGVRCHVVNLKDLVSHLINNNKKDMEVTACMLTQTPKNSTGAVHPQTANWCISISLLQSLTYDLISVGPTFSRQTVSNETRMKPE